MYHNLATTHGCRCSAVHQWILMEMLYLVTNRARESKVQHASAVKKSDKASDQTRAGSQILLGMSDQIYRSKKVLGFWSVSSSCRSVPSDFWRTQKIGPELGDYWPAFTVLAVQWVLSRAKNGIGTHAGDRTIDDMPRWYVWVVVVVLQFTARGRRRPFNPQRKEITCENSGQYAPATTLHVLAGRLARLCPSSPIGPVN